MAGGDLAFVPVLLGAVAREHLPDRADVAVVGRDEALARAGFTGAGLADFAVAGLAGVYGGLQDRERLVEVVQATPAGLLPAMLPNHEGNRLSQDLVRGQEFCAKAASSCDNDAVGWIYVRKLFGVRPIFFRHWRGRILRAAAKRRTLWRGGESK